MQYIYIGPVPTEESCSQVGNPTYPEDSTRECQVYSRMLQRLFPTPADVPVAYVTREQRHEFGVYREVAIRFDETNGAAVDFAHQVEREAPSEWDPIAHYELAWFERKRAYAEAVREKRLRPEEVPSHFGQANPPELAPGSSFSDLLSAYPL